MTGVFPSVIQTAKVVPVFEKDSKLNYSNYRPVSLLSNIEKILEKLMYKRPGTFLDNKNIFVEFQMIGLNPICLIAIIMYKWI